MNNIFRFLRIAAIPFAIAGILIAGCGDDRDNPVGPQTTYYDNYVVYVGSGGITYIQTDGSDRQVLVPGHVDSLLSPVWSPRKSEVVYVRITATGEEQIEVYRNNGSVDTLAMGTIDKSPWSPDGRKITYASNGAAFVIGTDGSPAKMLMTPAYEASFLDNNHIVCLSDPLLPAGGIYKVSIGDGTATKLCSPSWANLGESVHPRVMPDAQGVVFAEFHESYPPSRWNDFFRVDTDGSDVDTITRIQTTPLVDIVVTQMDVSYNGDYILVIHNYISPFHRNPYEIDIAGKSSALMDTVECSCDIRSIDYAPDSRDFVFENVTGGIAIYDRSAMLPIVLDAFGKHPNW